jgi:hypothetical protein
MTCLLVLPNGKVEGERDLGIVMGLLKQGSEARLFRDYSLRLTCYYYYLSFAQKLSLNPNVRVGYYCPGKGKVIGER